MSFVPGQTSDGDESSESRDSGLSGSEETGETEFVAEEKKSKVNTSTLGIFGLLVLCAGGTYFMYLRNGPQTANADDDTTTETINTFLTDGEKHVTLMKQMLQDTDKVVQRFRQSNSNTQIPLARLQTNPFRMLIPAVENANEGEVTSRRRREEERAAALQAVQDLKLQSVLFGNRRAAMLNNQMVAEGQTIEGFIVEKITADGVIVRMGVYRFELKMKK